MHLDGTLRGYEFAAMCPYCGRRGKFSVNVEKNLFHCFRASCDAHGHAARLIAYVEGIPTSSAFERFGKKLETSEPGYSKTKAFESPEFDVPLPDEFIPCFEAGRDPEYRVIRYIRDRIDNDTARRFGLGFCREGKYFNRVILPVRCPNGNAWTARDATDDWKTNDRRPKYVNAEGDWAASLLFGWEQYTETGGDLAIVEGAFDVMRFAMHGIPAIALLGKELGSGQRALLHRLARDTTITLLIDPEEKRWVTDALASQLCMRFSRLYVGRMELGIDPGNSTKEQAYQSIDKARPWQ